MNGSARLATATMLAAASLAAPGHGQCLYELTEYDSPGCGSALPYAINESGVVTGWHHQCNSNRDAFRLELPDGPITTIERLPDMQSAEGHAISEAGVIVGQVSIANDGLPQLAFTWHDGEWTILELMLGSTISEAWGVNSSGRVVGRAGNHIVGPVHAAIWDDGEITLLDELSAPNSQALAVNEGGDVVGWMGGGSATTATPFLLTRDGELIELGLPPDTFTAHAVDINERRSVLVQGRLEGHFTRSFLWRDGAYTPLGILPGFERAHAFDLNEDDVVVGTCSGSGQWSRGFIWRDGVLIDLNDLVLGGWPPGDEPLVRSARAITDSGVIAGSGDSDAIILRPVADGADVTCDGTVGIDDLLRVLDAWGPCGVQCIADLDGDGFVGIGDMAMVIAGWQ